VKVLCGGDLLSGELAGKLLDSCRELWNMYGPTETTIWSSIKKIEKPKDSSNIGSPIDNTQFYIVDENKNLMPVGTKGAIYIGGKGLAKSYYKKTELTKQKFIASPFDTAALIYETGDVGKWNSRGEIEFLGRNDNQVKIRGFRIELGDIESKLLQIGQIKTAVVVVSSNTPEKHLVAYLVGDESLDMNFLKTELSKSLPAYMIPVYFVQLDEIPLTPNKKVNRKLLSNVEKLELQTGVEYVAPETTYEVTLVECWKKILQLEKIGLKDNFFDLGGNSLSATRLLNLIQKEFKIKLTINDLFKNATLETQAALIENILIWNDNADKEDINSEIEKFIV